MSDTTNFSQNLDTLFTDLHNFVDTDSVLGKPLAVGDKTLVPVMSVTLGYGDTGMATKMQKTNTANATSGVGLGAKISTSAVVVVDKDGVSMLPINEKSNLGQMMDKIPQALSTLGQNVMQPSTNQQQQSQGAQGNGNFKYTQQNDGG
ncbi:MAG: sporulation protein [Clostridium lundense]|nr:sporulation protein [Clostridium lundense]